MNYAQLPFLKSRRGMSPLGLFFLVIIIIMILFLLDMAFILGSQCKDSDDAIDCALNVLLGEESEAPQGTVTATGVLSGEFKGENHSVTVSLHIPLEGGAVTGNFSGDCDGSIKGTYVRESSAISGSGNGSCAFIIPASGIFSGSVNREAKSVHVSGEGSAAGFSKSGSVVLTY